MLQTRVSALLLLFICLGLFTTAQQPGWQWMASGGGGGFTNSSPSNPHPDFVTGRAIDKDGNVIVGGGTTWSPIFDTISFSNTANWQNSNFFLAKYDKCGNVLWARVGGGDGVDAISGLDVDDAGNIYVLGTLQGSGNPCYIRTPLKDTTLYNCSYFFAKFDPNGNLAFVRTYTGYGYNQDGTFKRLHNGNFLSIVTKGSGSATLGNFQINPYTRNFVLWDSIGLPIKGAMIDSNYQTGTNVGSYVIDENDRIYFAVTNIDKDIVKYLNRIYDPAPHYTAYLFQTDKNFNVLKENISGYYQETIQNLSYSNGYLYASGRNTNGAIFDSDTTFTNLAMGKFTVYKIDTGTLTKTWVSRPTIQSVSPSYTKILPGASKDNLYLGYQHRGNVVWDSASLTVPANNSRMAMLRLRTSDGVCVGGQFANGGNNSKDVATDIITDEQGNGYMLGTFNGYIGVPNDSAYAQGGTSSPDYFILKWGLPCSNDTSSLDRPDAPAALTATATGTQTIQVSWGSSNGYQQGYQLYRSPDGVNNWSLVTTTAANVTIYTDGNLTPATTYWYKASAYNAIGQSGFTNVDSATTLSGQCSAVISYTQNDSLYTFSTTNTGTPAYTYQWSINGTAAGTGATTSTVLNTAGTYNVCVTVTDASQCSSTSCQSVTITGIADWQTLQVALFPNPTRDIVYINLTSPEAFKAELTIYDIHGRLTGQRTLAITTGSNSIAVTTASWPAGRYLVKLTTTGGVYCKGVVKY
ncbi:MAG TPA: T9SS type A sorting domain-containing protein [Chitinophagales bacterium]|nr:T9SS type A sorting domain-containing protein [Chitinophagales bacterium]